MGFELTRREAMTGLAAGTILGVGGCASLPAQGAQSCDAGMALAMEADRLLALLPEVATYNGTEAALDGGPLARRLNDYSPAGEQALREGTAASRARIAALDCPRGSRDALHAAVSEAVLANAQRSASIPYGRINPFSYVNHLPYLVSQISGPHIDSQAVMTTQQSVRTPEAIDAWLEKLDGFEQAFAGVLEKVRADEAAGCRPPRALLAKTLPVLDAFLEGPAEAHPLIEAFDAGMAAAVTDTTLRATALHFAITSLETRARPAIARLRDQIAAMLPRGQEMAGVWAQPEGEALYAANVLALGDTEQSPDEIHDIGLDEVRRITAEMDALLIANGETGGSVGERMLRLAGDERFLFADSDAGRRELLDYVGELAGQAEANYGDMLPPEIIPQQQLVIRRVPVATQDSAPGGYYDAPSLDGTRPGTYWINLRDMRAVPRFRLPTLTYHEGVPGHHTQVAIASGLGEAPLIIRIASFNGYQEGWALYAERLAKELGYYEDDPFGDLGRLQDELFRAVRLVVDTGLHHKRWTREQAIRFMQGATGIAESRVTAEIERYMAWPGQALGYKLGQLRLIELRDRMRAARGDAFDVRNFNAIVLNQGAMPIGLVADRVAAASR
ncbi:DUF885 domain-containing protein [Parasphingopyxis algicola]|uniref:DUF885 domain-containing protein n=1 Tax=Parasphingopyxis algicola TaxID=2026624 RepID=UPI0015A25853|nr:DUF885 domain-containing protein [Parasphingopyxis algicola]QLC24332.1 DUF885 domain-containing protein [Parasphingopyxis algicola]